MDESKLISIVREHEELYDTSHHHYSNQKRRDNIWEEIGTRMNDDGLSCKERWYRIRDNYRKALILRKTRKSEVKLMKPPKFYKELSFLIPYLTDDENRRLNLSHEIKETEFGTVSTSRTSCESSIPSASQSPNSAKRKRYDPDNFNLESVLKDYLANKNISESKNNKNSDIDPLTEFFLNMARTVKTFPLQDQIQMKTELFRIVNSVEMRLASEAAQ